MSRFPARLAVGAAACLTVPPTVADAQQGPPQHSFLPAFARSVVAPNLQPSGAGDFSCHPSATHPRPVILLHGTFANPYNSFAALSPALRRAGYCVFAPAYGRTWLPFAGGMRSVRGSAEALASYVNRVRSATGAAQVDLVGYSQGALVARAYLRWYGGTTPAAPARNVVANLVGLSAVNHGTRLGGVTRVVNAMRLQPLLRGALGQGPLDLLDGSPLLRDLARGGETEPGVRYTMLTTQTDEINVPARDAQLSTEGNGEVTNIDLQRGCPIDLSDHFNITYSPRAIALVTRALGGAAPLPCTLRLPFV